MEKHIDQIREYVPEEVSEHFSVDEMLDIFNHQARLAYDPKAIITQPIPEQIARSRQADLHVLFANAARYQDNSRIRGLIDEDTVTNALKEQRRKGSDPQDTIAAIRIRRTTLAYLYTYVPHVFQNA